MRTAGVPVSARSPVASGLQPSTNVLVERGDSDYLAPRVQTLGPNLMSHSQSGQVKDWSGGQVWLLKLTKWWAQCQCHGILQWPYSDWTTILLTFMWRPHVTYECGSVLDGAFPSHMYEDVMLQETSSQLPWTATSGLESGGHTFTIISSVSNDNSYLTCFYYPDPKGNFQCLHQIYCNNCTWLDMYDYRVIAS